MFYLTITLLCFMSVFCNVLFYIISLLALSIIVLFWLVRSNQLSTLMFLLILIVYVGAIMILIGYVCAVSPNFNLTPIYENYWLIVFLPIIYFFYESYLGVLRESAKSGALLDYFFRSWGFFFFLIVVFMLFLTLLIVTSQYRSPQGPFRSI